EEKSGESGELETAGAERATYSRREGGWAARWWTGQSPRFACASTASALPRAIADAARVETAADFPPEWPSEKSSRSGAAPGVEAPPDLCEELQRRVAAESRGEAALKRLTLRRGASVERIVNGRGLDVSFPAQVFDGIALAAGRKGARACEGRAVFRWEREADM